MVQSRCRFGLLREAVQAFGIQRDKPRQHLEGYIALKTMVPSAVDFPHAA